MLDCFCCGKVMETVWDQQGDPAGGMMWRSYGNYGSGMFDSMRGNEWLEIVICDDCVDAGAKAGRVTYVERPRVPEPASVRMRYIGREDPALEGVISDAWTEEFERNPPWSGEP